MLLFRPATLAASVLALATPASAASVSLLTQERSVSISIPSNDPVADPPVDRTVSAAGFGEFGGFLAEEVAGAFDQFSEASASQNSFFSEVFPLDFTGPHVLLRSSGVNEYRSFATGGLTFSDSDFLVTFAVDAPTDYSVSAFGEYTDTSGGASGFHISLADAAGMTELHGLSAGGSDGPEGDGDIENLSLSESGTLATGSYTLRAGSGVSGGIGGTFASHFVELELRSSTLVPSPAALPAGLLLGGATLLTRRRA